MSFWEDRFVNRPHASAVPANDPADLNTPDDSVEPDGGQQGQAWSDVSESEIEVGTRRPFGFGYQVPSEEIPEEAVQEEDVPASVEDDDVHTLEYRRSGLLRRRRPVPVENEVEAEETSTYPAESTVYGAELPAKPSHDEGSGESDYSEHSWTIVEPELEPQRDVVDDVATAEDSPAVEYRRSGIFRRRRPVTVEASAEADDEAFAALQEYVVSAGRSEQESDEHPWAVVESPAAADPIELETGQIADEYVEESASEQYAAGEIEDAPVEHRRRGLFRRRGEDVEADIEHDDEPEEVFEPEVFETEAELTFVAEADEELEAPKPRRRGLFRRRSAEPAVLDDDAEVMDRDPVEDDAFENVDLYPALAAYAQADDGDAVVESAPEESAHDEPEPFVAESDENAGAADEPADEAHAVPSEEPVADDAYVASNEEPVADEPAVDEAAGDEHAHEPAPEHEPVEELEPALPVLTLESHDGEPSATDPFADEYDEPVPMRKKNGRGGSRGKRVVGLKVGASQIAAAVVTGNGDSPALVEIARRPLEPGVVVDGELRDPEALAHALRSFFKDHGLPPKNVRLGLSSSRVGVRTFDISGVEDESRFDNAVRFKAHEVLPVAAHESALDYRVVEERFTESGEVSHRVLLVVAPRDQVEPYIEACRSAGLRLAGVDLEAFGLLRAFVPPLGARSRSEDSATVVVAVGHESSTLLVAGGGICEFTRVFDWGGGALQEAIAEELEVPLMEAATILTHLSLSGPGRHLDSLDADTRGRALQAVRARLMPFARELVSSLQFYQTQPESLGIREILITGGTSHLEGLADALHQMIGVSVSVGDPLGRVSVQTEIPTALDAQIGSMAVPVGLAIEDDPARSVNLLPKDDRTARKKPNVLAVAIPLAAAVPLAALAFLFMQANGSVSDQQAQLDAVRSQIAALPEPTRPNIDPALAGEQATRATAVAQILGGRLSWERVLGDISRVLPKGVSLTELSATAPQPTTPEVPVASTDGSTTTAPPPAVAAPTTPTGVTVTGYALEYATIARTLARIQAVPSLTNAQLQSATPVTLGQKRVIEFTIVADLATTTPGGAQ